MSVLSELQKLLTKMGGTPQSGDNTDETVRKITAAYSGGSGLPEYTREDKGKILALDDSEETEPSVYTLIPEQTVTTDNSGVASIDVNRFIFNSNIGKDVTVTINGAVYTEPIEMTSRGSRITLPNADGDYILINDRNITSTGHNKEYTISATIIIDMPVIKPLWKTTTSGGLFVIDIWQESNTWITDSTPSEVFSALESGSTIYVSMDGFRLALTEWIEADETLIFSVTAVLSGSGESGGSVRNRTVAMLPFRDTDTFIISVDDTVYP